MRKILYLVCAFILAWGCTREPQELNEDGMQEKSSFSVDEAKQFFEKHMSSVLATRSTSDKNGFIPGDFTVDWAAAAYSADQTHCNIELPINAQYRFRVMRTEETNGVITAYAVSVYQKLVVVKNLKTDKVSNYVMTLIPDHRYAQMHRNFDPQSFSVYGDHADFSGLIVYSTLENVSRPVQVCIFRDGRKKGDYSIFKDPTKRTENFVSIVRTLRGIQVMRKAHVATRSGEDGWWDDEIYDGGVIDPVVIVPDDSIWIDPVEVIGKPDGPIEGADGMTNDEWLDASKPGGEVEPDGTPYLPDGDEDASPPSSGGDTDPDGTIKSHNIDVTGTAEERDWIKACLDKIAESKIGKELLDKIASMDIKINCVDQIPGYPNAEALAHSNGTVDANRPSNGGLFEDLFHELQFHTPPTDQSRGNREFEAKCADAIAAQEGLYFGGSNEKWDLYLDYMNDPTKENLDNAIADMRNDGYDEDKFPIDTTKDMTPHLDNFTNK